MVRRCALVLVAGCGFSGPSIGDSPNRGGPDAAPGRRDAGAPDASTLAKTTDCVDLADTYISENNEETNYGTETTMYVDGDTAKVSLVRFNLSGIPPGAVIQSAELIVWSTTDTGDPGNIYQMLQTWDETAATFSSATSATKWLGGDGAGPPSRDTVVLGTVDPADGNTMYTVALPTTVVAQWVGIPSSNFGLAIATTLSNGSQFTTRESATGLYPILRVVHTP